MKRIRSSPPVRATTDPTSLQNGRYEILSKLGEGGRGIVYKARDTRLERVVAVKLLRGEGVDAEVIARFRSEAQLAGRLSHPNIVQVHDIGVDNGRPFEVMELVDGTSLRDLLEAHAPTGLDLPNVLAIGTDVSRALSYAHSQGVLHRDVKPENILLSRHGGVKLMDFGLARALDQPRLTLPGTMVGTPAYMAPENALGKDSDARSDLYSLGAVLYEMATGRPMFAEPETVKQVYHQIHDLPVAPSRARPGLSPDLEGLILRLIAKNPNDRPASATDVLRALDAIAEKVGTVATTSTASTSIPAVRTGSAPSESRRTPTPELRRTVPFVARESELSAVKAAVDSALRGEGTTLFMSGEAGVGKTRLAEEARSYAALRGMSCLSGRCEEIVAGVPYAPWLEMLRSWVARAPRSLIYKVAGNSAADLLKLLPELGEVLGPTRPEPADAASQEARRRFLEGVARVFTRMADEGPLFIFLDDLQWADPGSLDLLRIVVRACAGKFVVILGAYRDVDSASNSLLRGLLLDFNRDRRATSLPLARFDVAGVADLLRAISGDPSVSDEFRDFLFEKSGGNPFFVEEILRSLAEDGTIFRTPTGWDRKPIAEIRLPDTVRAVIEQRLSRLDDETRKVLQIASVFGIEFPFDLLPAIAEIEEERALAALESALRARLVVERQGPPGRPVHAFADRQVRDTLYEGMSLIRRRRVELKAAHALEASYGEKALERAAELADLFLRGNDPAKALVYARVAGARAARVYAHTEALRWYRTALDLLEEEADPSKRAEVLIRLADEEDFLGQVRAELRDLGEAVEEYHDAGREVEAASLLIRVARLQILAFYDPKAGGHFLNEARSILESRTESRELAEVYCELAHLQLGEADVPAASDAAKRALALAEHFGAGDLIVQALGYLCWCVPFREKAEAQELLDRALSRVPANPPSPMFIHYVSLLHLFGFAVLGQTERGLRGIQRAVEQAEKVGAVSQVRDIEGQDLAESYIRLGELSTAQRLAQATYEFAIREYPTPDAPNLLVLAELAGLRGDVAASEALFARTLAIERSFRLPYPHGGVARIWARFLVDRGELARAEELLIPFVDVFERGGGPVVLVTRVAESLDLLVEIDLRQGDSQSARRRLDRLAEIARGFDGDTVYGYAHRAEGRWAASARDLAGATRAFEASIAVWTRLRWKYELARTEYLLGLTFQELGMQGQAAGPFGRALELFTEMDSRPDLERVLARKKLLGA